MNPLISSFIGTLIRRVLGYGGAFLVARGLYTNEEMATYIAAAVGVLLDLGFSFWQKYTARANFVNALNAPAGTSEDKVKAMTTPLGVSQKVLAVLLSVSLAASTIACASGAIQHQVASYGAQATALGLQAQNLVLAADKSGLQPNKDLTAKSMVAFKELGGGLQKLADALTLYDSLVPAEQGGQTLKIEALLQEARRLSRVVLLFVGSEALGQQLSTLFDNLDAVYLEITRALRPVPA